MNTTPSLDTYWVIQDRFLAGAYPGGMDESSTRRKIQTLLHADITTIIDLTEDGDSFLPYSPFLDEECKDFEKVITRLNYPIPDFYIPSVELMSSILNAIDQNLADGKNIYLHCIGGIGRTGTTVACYLIRHGLTGPEALAQLEFLRKGVSSWWRRSPESDDQIDFVLHWQAGN